jgi:hypothetical protein
MIKNYKKLILASAFALIAVVGGLSASSFPCFPEPSDLKKLIKFPNKKIHKTYPNGYSLECYTWDLHPDYHKIMSVPGRVVVLKMLEEGVRFFEIKNDEGFAAFHKATFSFPMMQSEILDWYYYQKEPVVDIRDLSDAQVETLRAHWLSFFTIHGTVSYRFYEHVEKGYLLCKPLDDVNGEPGYTQKFVDRLRGGDAGEPTAADSAACAGAGSGAGGK